MVTLKTPEETAKMREAGRIVAVMPTLIGDITGVQTLRLGGTSILIVVGVVVETMKQLEAQLLQRSYEGFIR